MGRQANTLGRYLSRDTSPAKAAGAETTSTTSATVELGDKRVAHIDVVVSAVSGTTPTLLVDVYSSNDGTTFFKVATIGANGWTVGGVAADPTAITAAGTYRALVSVGQFVQTRSRIAGTTPSFNYSVNFDAA